MAGIDRATAGVGETGADGWGSPFVGRTREVLRIAELMNQSRDSSWTVVVDGPAGIGKSRLLEEIRQRCERLGDRVLASRATEFEQVIPFGLFLDTIDELPGFAGRPLLGGDAGHGPSLIDQHRLYRRLRESLEELADGTGLLITLDDVQWADEASLGLLEFLLQRPPAGRVGLVLAHRSGTCPHRLVRALASLPHPPLRLRLPPLQAADVDLMLPGLRPGRRRALTEASAGNPLYLKLLNELPTAAVSALSGSAPIHDEAVAALLDHTVRADLGRLEPQARLVARAAAVGGGEATADLIAAIAQLPESAVLDALDLLTAHGVLVATDDWFRFTHPLLRNAAYYMAGHGWRITAHRRAADHLASVHAPAMLRAQHLEHSLRQGDAATCAELAEAAALALASAPATSAHWLTKALHALPDTPDTAGQRIDFQFLLGRALLASGQLEQANGVLQELSARLGPRHREAAMLLAQCNRIQGRSQHAYAMLEATEAVAEGRDNELIMIELATIDLMSGRVDAGMRRARTLIQKRATLGPTAAAAATTLLALSAAGRGEIGRAVAELEAASQAVDALPEHDLRTALDAVVPPLAWAAHLLERYDLSLYCLDRAIRVARSHGHLYALPHLYTIQSFTLTKLGRLGEALEAAEDAEEGARAFGATDILALAGVAKLHPTLWIHGPDAVRGAWEEARRLPEPDSDWFRISVSTMIVDIGLQLDAEIPRDAARLLDLGQDRQTDPMLPVRWGLAAQLSAAAGDTEQAGAWAERSVKVAADMGLAGQLGTALLSRAATSRTLEDHPSATAEATAAHHAFRAAGQPVHEGRAHLLAAEAAVECGWLDAAEAHLALARALFRESGADWLERCAARVQRRLVALRTARPHADRPALTEREQQVADLVADGMTNQEIGARLILSPRTVETYVTRLLAKLGVSSRAGIPRQLEKLLDGRGENRGDNRGTISRGIPESPAGK